VADDALRWAFRRAAAGPDEPRAGLLVALLGATAGNALDPEGVAAAVDAEAGRLGPDPEWRHFAALTAHAAGGRARRTSDLRLTDPTPAGVERTDQGGMRATALIARTLELSSSLEPPGR
jgi:hypothetical protein